MLVRVLLSLLIGAAAVATPSPYLERWAEKEQLAQQLEHWLTVHLKDNADPKLNILEAGKAAAAQPALRPLVDALRLISTARGCDQSVRDALALLSPQKRYGGQKRIGKVLAQLTGKIPTSACFKSLEKEFKSESRRFEPATKRFLQRVREVGLKYIGFGGEQSTDKYLSTPGLDDLENYKLRDFERAMGVDVKFIAAGDPRALIHEKVFDQGLGRPVSKFHPENYRYTFEKYLRKPCEQYVESTKRIFEGFYGVSNLLVNPTLTDEPREYNAFTSLFTGPLSADRRVKSFKFASSYLSKDFQNGILAYKRCRLIETYDEKTVSDSFAKSDYNRL